MTHDIAVPIEKATEAPTAKGAPSVPHINLLSTNRTPVVRLIFETNEDRDRARTLLKEALALVKHYSFNPALKQTARASD